MQAHHVHTYFSLPDVTTDVDSGAVVDILDNAPLHPPRAESRRYNPLRELRDLPGAAPERARAADRQGRRAESHRDQFDAGLPAARRQAASAKGKLYN